MNNPDGRLMADTRRLFRRWGWGWGRKRDVVCKRHFIHQQQRIEPVFYDGACIPGKCLYNAHDAVAFKIPADEEHVFARFNFIYDAPQRIIYAACELNFLHAESIADPEKLDSYDPDERNAYAGNENVQYSFVHDAKIMNQISPRGRLTFR
jgi:hypothetical protein